MAMYLDKLEAEYSGKGGCHIARRVDASLVEKEQARGTYAARARNRDKTEVKSRVALEAKALGERRGRISSSPRCGDGNTSNNGQAFGG
jgi:hypothetical protein